MAVDINAIIILIVCCILYGIFLFYDIFRKGEKWGYLAYIMAVIPVNYLWYSGFDILGVYMILILLWTVCLIRDLLFVYRKDKEYDDILLFLGLGILVQLILTAILPAEQLLPHMQGDNTIAIGGYFYFPDIYTDSFGLEEWASNSKYLLGFRASVTLMIFLALLPMLLDLKGSEEHVPLIAIIIIDLIFVLPFLYVSFIWLPQNMYVLTLLFAVILFIILLIITKD